MQVNSDGSRKRYAVKESTVLTQNGRDELIPRRSRRKAKPGAHGHVVQPDCEQQQASSIEKTGVRFRKLQVGSTVVLRLVEYTPKVVALPTSIVIGAAHQLLRAG